MVLASFCFWQENLKIFLQYTKLLAQACHQHVTHQAAHVQHLSQTPKAYQRALEWFQHLAQSYSGLEEPAMASGTQLLQLHAACDKSVPANSRNQA